MAHDLKANRQASGMGGTPCSRQNALAAKRMGTYPIGMNREHILATLRQHEAELQRLGVRHAALFGSVARGDAGPGSDIDIAIDLDEEALPDLFAYAGMKRYIAGLFPGPVDVVDRAALRPGVRDLAAADLVYAF